MSAPRGRVLVTGASGFVGRALVARLVRRGYDVRAASRSEPVAGTAFEQVQVAPLGPDTDWRAAVADVDVVVHLAARVHVLAERDLNPQAAFRAANVAGSLALARAAAEAGVRGLVLMSSIGAVATEADVALDEDATPRPTTAYGGSKLEAEQAVASALRATGTRLCVLRPPLVFGPGAPGNAGLLERAIRGGLPLPLASVRNRRSFIAVADLAEAVTRVIERDAAGTFHVAHPSAVSTPELARSMAAGMGRRARLLPCPPGLLELAGRAAGRRAAVRGLTRSLVIDARRLYRELDWIPEQDLAAAMADRSLQTISGARAPNVKTGEL